MKAVIVSGGNGGLGQAICVELANDNIHPIVTYRNGAEQAQELANQIGGTAIQLDLQDPETIDAAVGEILKMSLEVAGVVFAASPKPTLDAFTKITAEDMETQWQVNVLGPQQLLARLIKRIFRKQKSGFALGVLSSAMGDGKTATGKNMGAYVIAKFGLQGVLATAAGDYPWLQTGTISPGFIETSMLEIFDERFLDMLREQLPNKRFSTPEEVAETVLNLVKENI